MIVVDGIVQSRPIIPKRNAPGFPPKPTGKLRLRLELVQELQQRRAFLRSPAVKTLGMRDVDVEALLARLGMRSHGRVVGDEGVALVAGVLDPVFPRLGGVGFGGCVDCREGAQRLL